MTDLFAAPQPELRDAEARRLALDTHRSAIVEAPAGSGKTGLLMQRFLKLLLDDSVDQPEEVLALTFTNKAAAEMRERVLEQLHHARDRHELKPGDAFEAETRALALAVLDRDRDLGWGLLDRPQRLNLRTIDSLAAELANALPLVSGAGAPRTPAEDARPLYHAAARRTLDQLGGTDPALDQALRTLLLHRDLQLQRCEQLLAAMLAQREQWGELVPLGPTGVDEAALDREVHPRLEHLLETIVCEGLSHAARLLPAGVLDELTQIASALGVEPSSPLAACANRTSSPEAKADHLEQWLGIVHLLIAPSSGSWRKQINKGTFKVAIDKQVETRLKSLIAELQDHPLSEHVREALCSLQELPPARYPDDQWRVARALFFVLRHALVELRLLFAERGECDFTELALAARRALREDEHAPDLALAYGGRLRHLLVDEMQDTSAGQYELITLLTRSFDGHSQTVFLVGDPKQSIYLFRQARVERFLHTVAHARLGEIALTPLRLTTNFRSQAALVEHVNLTFRPLFVPLDDDRPLRPGEIAFVEAHPTRPASETALHLRWHADTLPAIRRRSPVPPSDDEAPDEETSAGIRRSQARTLREIVDRWRATPLPPGRTRPWSIAVLGRSRAHLVDILAEFKQDRGHGPVPYRALKIDLLARRPEVLDLLALTRALLHPADRTAWLAVLRAPWCGLALADLHALTGEGVAQDSRELDHATLPSLIPARRHLLSVEGQLLLDRAWPALSAAIDDAGTTPAALHVERTWRSLGGDLPLPPDARENARRYLALLHQLTRDGAPLNLRLLEQRLDDLYAEPPAQEDAVDVLTMHGAKGLEWDLVLVPQLERGGGQDREPLLNWIEVDLEGAEASSMLLAPIAGSGEASSKLNEWIRRARQRRAAAELRRLFYVACTRAREELHLFTAVRRKDNGEWSQPRPGSLLHAAWPAAQQSITVILETGLETGLEIADPQHPGGLTLAEEALLDDADLAPGIALAAASSEPPPPPPLLVERLPAGFDPTARFREAAAHRLPYTLASALPSAPAFDRPEGSFAVRAFGNVVHRFLQRIAEILAAGNNLAADLATLAAELSTWEPRLAASLRAEGLPPALVKRDAARALQALHGTLADPIGRWLLSPHPGAASEQEIALAGDSHAVKRLRADRIFSTAVPPPGLEAQFESPGLGPITWIVDFKTAEQGSRSDELFEREQRARYGAQLDSYAASLRALRPGTGRILLGLYFPVSRKLLWWDSLPPAASNQATAAD